MKIRPYVIVFAAAILCCVAGVYYVGEKRAAQERAFMNVGRATYAVWHPTDEY